MEAIRRALTGRANAPTLTFERVYRATPADLRSACTSPERLARWLGTVDGKPAAVGDTFRVRLGDEPQDVAACQVTQCEDELVAVSWKWGDEPASTLSARFTAVAPGTGEDRTLLTLQHSLAEDEVLDYGQGWERLLAQLAESLGETHTGAGSSAADLAGDRWAAVTRRPLRLERDFAAPPEEVWARFASADGLKSWWWKHWSDTEVEADVREGGTYRVASPDAGVGVTGRFVTVEPAAHLAMTWQWHEGRTPCDAHEAGENAPDEAVDLTFFPTPTGTRVVLQHTGPWRDDTPAENYRQGWGFTLGQLAETLAAEAS